MATSIAFGQVLTGYGAKVGLNLANIGGAAAKENFTTDPIMRLGIAAGGFATFDFGLPVLIRPEVMFSQKGYEMEIWYYEHGYVVIVDFMATLRINYLDINALAVYPINDQIYVFAGPSFSQFLSGKYEEEWDARLDEERHHPWLPWFLDAMEKTPGEEDINAINETDMGLILGGGYTLEMPLGNIDFEARYSLGLKNVFGRDLVMKNNVIQIIVGYSL